MRSRHRPDRGWRHHRDRRDRGLVGPHQRRFRDWLTFLADDIKDEVPVCVTREGLADWELSPTSRIFDDDKDTLEVRVRRLETDFAWAEQPPSRTRHYVTNVIVDPTDKRRNTSCHRIASSTEAEETTRRPVSTRYSARTP
ncbi:aromatic-ring-hydroxylating dioxygenase subunit beta [Rhodococcus opacus]|uniref:aromatic-ring-hydroxylating dioxygenase subunit beta n=1 Tax=Rhodococcus opacus TaxID=37919 RepID=UPI0039EC6F26